MTESLEILKDVSHLNAGQHALFALFDTLEIPQVTYMHPAIFTVEEGMALDLPNRIDGLHGKSLFLKTNDDQLWLVVAAEDTRVDLKALSIRLGTKRFSFAKPEKMVAVLGVTPGSATPFALMNDADKLVNVVLDERFTQVDLCVFHPLRNDCSTQIAVKDLLRFIAHFGYRPHILALV